MKLHTNPISPKGKAVRIAAAELGVALDLVNLDFQKGEARLPDYLALNPMGKVPTLVDGDFALWETGAILCYMAEGAKSDLLPKEPRAHADTLRWLFFGASHLDPYFTTLIVERFIKGRQSLPEDEALTRSAEQWLARFVPVLEQQLARHEFVVGPFSIADIALGCTVELSQPLKYDLTPYPAVRGWLERLHARESWRTA